jgi:hypothetical protein
MLCPHCRSERCRRSRRHKIADYCIGVTGVRPWRCSYCEHRFYATIVALRFWPLAHCARCGNLNLQRISREYVTGGYAWFFKLVRAPAFRCEPCRYRFFSIRPNRKILPSSKISPDPQTQSEIVSR